MLGAMETPRIRILPPETAKRIAAGEVIDRPAAALRELLDNALDAGASLIQVELEGGGAEGLRVADDGMGMGKEDLARSVLPHATSKIRDADDLLTLSTLGFRGEALASMAAVSSLSILSAGEDDYAWGIRCEAGKEPVLEPSRCSRGTVVQLRDLFSNFPARRQFLKRASAEANACRQVFVEKALPFPEVGFRLYSGGKPLLVLQPAGLARRVIEATGAEEPESFFRELVASGPGFGARIVTCSPASYRTDKKRLHIYVNKRRVQEYSLAQAVEYAFRDSLPGGTYPGAYVFLEVDPSLADFNIHPAKKEVRLRNLEDIRRGLIASIRAYLGSAAKAERANSLLADAPRQIPLDLDYGRPRDYSRNVDSQAERSSWSVIADLARERRESHGGQDEDEIGRAQV